MKFIHRGNYADPDGLRIEKKRGRHETAYVQLDTSKCTACFKCVEACSKNVIGKINILIHKHAIIRNGGECTGCGRCVKVCDAGALSIIQKQREMNE